MKGKSVPKRRKLDFNPLRSDDRFAVPARPVCQKWPCGLFYLEIPKSNWERIESSTPRAQSSYASTPRQQEFDGPEPFVTEEDSNALDRDWYDGDEFGHTFGDDRTILSAHTTIHGQINSERQHWPKRKLGNA